MDETVTNFYVNIFTEESMTLCEVGARKREERTTSKSAEKPVNIALSCCYCFCYWFVCFSYEFK